MRYAVVVIVVIVAGVLISGLAHGIYSVMQTIAAALGGAA